jgi:hypothetical protein
MVTMMARITEKDLDRRLQKIMIDRYARIAAQHPTVQQLHGYAPGMGDLDGLFSKIGKAIKKVVTAPVKAVQQVAHVINAAAVKILPVSDSLKARVESALNKPVDIQTAVVKASVGDTGDLRTMLKHDVEESKKVLKVVLPIVAIVAQFFPGIGTVIGIAAGLASAGMKASEARTTAKHLKEQAAQVAAQDQAAADEAIAQATLLEQQAAAYDEAAADVSAALQAGYISEGMTGQQIQDGVAKWSLAVRGINISTGEAQTLLSDTIVQATQQAATQLAQQKAAAAAASAAAATPALLPIQSVQNPLMSSSIFSGSTGSAAPQYYQPTSMQDAAGQSATDGSAPLTTAGGTGINLSSGTGLALVAAVIGLSMLTAKPERARRSVPRGTKRAKR